nr:MAG: capsid protein [Cressdnaviricota sp.]
MTKKHHVRAFQTALGAIASRATRKRGNPYGGGGHTGPGKKAKKDTKWNVSHTKTMTKNKKKKKGPIKATGGSLSTHHLLKYKPSKATALVKAISEPATFISTQAIGLVSPVGQATVQAAFAGAVGTSTSTFIQQPDIIGILLQGGLAGNSAVQNFNNATRGQSFKFELQKVIHQYELINQTPGTVRVRLWDCVSKVTRQTYTSPVADWITFESANAPSAAVNLGTPGQWPTVNKGWNMTWKVAKYLDVEMRPGEKWTHTWDFQPRRVMDTEYWGSTGTGTNVNSYSQVRGLTHCTMFQVYGSMGDTLNSNIFAAQTSTTGIGYGPAKVAVIQTSTTTTRMWSNFQRTFFMQTGLTTAPASGPFVESDDVDGTVINLSTALNYG